MGTTSTILSRLPAPTKISSPLQGASYLAEVVPVGAE
jgi:hypothetical protein